MAITAANLFSGHALSVSQLTASISPGANKLDLVVACSFFSGGGGNTPTVSGIGGTWVQVVTQLNATGDERITVFRDLSASPGSGTITVDWGGQAQGAAFMWVDEFTGTDTSGAHGSGAIVQSVGSNAASGTSTGFTLTLAALGSANNAAYGSVKNNTTAAISAGTGFTELYNNTATASSESEWAINKTAVAWTWGSQTVATYGIALEIKAPSVAASAEYGTSINVSSFNAANYRDYSTAPVNLSLYSPVVTAPFLARSLPVPFDTKSYRDTAYWDNPSAFLPNIIQSPVQGQLGVPFNSLSYRDTSNYNDSSNAFLPFIIQPPVQALSGVPFSGLTYRDPANFDPSPNAFLPQTVQGPVQSLLGVSYNGLNYRDYSTGPGNPNLFPIVSVSPFFNPAAAVPFSGLGYLDAGNYDNAFLPFTIQGPVQSLLGGQFNSLSYRDSYFDSNAFLPGTIQGQIQSALGVPFNSLGYRDSFEFPSNPNLTQAIVAPFFGLSIPRPFDTKSYRDNTNLDANAFLPNTIQGPVQSLLGAPFSSLTYRDLANIGANSFLPNIIQTPAETLLNFIDNIAPYNSRSYRDPYAYPINLMLYPPPLAVQSPFFNPFPFVRFDPKAYADTTAFFKNAFLPATIQNQIQSLLGAPFNQLAFRDLANSGRNAFLPQTIQSAVQSLLGTPFSGLGYRDSFVILRNAGLYPAGAVANPFVLPVLQAAFNALAYRDSYAPLRNPSLYAAAVANPFFAPWLSASFNPQAYRDTAYWGNPNAFLPQTVQSPVQSLLGAPFNAGRYLDTFEYLPNAFLPRIIQPSVRSLLGAPFSGLGYRDSFIAPVNLDLLHPGAVLVPFFMQLLGIPFSALTYRDFSNYDNALLPVKYVPGEIIRLQGSVTQIILLDGKTAQITSLGGSVNQIEESEGSVTQITLLGGNVDQIEEPD